MGVLQRSKAGACRMWPRVQEGLYGGLVVSLWLAGSALVTLGMVTGVFFWFSGAALHPFLLHLHNLTVRYVAADGLRQAAFAEMLTFGMAGLLAIVCLLRLPVLCRRLGAAHKPCPGDQA